VRRRLLEKLRNTLDFKVTIVSAPTGYGKTTLLAHWRQVEEADLSFAWVFPDEQDDDPVRLWRHIVESLRRVLSVQALPDEVRWITEGKKEPEATEL
jgi:LuxR family maltose regulon positive regulatory protein